jgi:uncharacterized protein YqhQ
MGKILKQKSKQKGKKITNEKGKNNKRWLIGLIVTAIVSFVVGGILAPIVGAFFGEAFSPKPTVRILRDETCIVPMM